MELLVCSIQSFSDVVTNSSSELFVANTDLSDSQIDEVLEAITSGYKSPFRFSLEEYRKAKSNKEEDYEYPWEDYLWGYCGYYSIVNGWFTDIEDEVEVCNYRLCQLNYEKYYRNKSLLYKEFIKRFGEDFYYDGNTQEIIKFLKEWENSGKELPSWWEPRDTVQSLDGKILIISEEDNSIPYDSFDFIDDVLHAYHIHLG